MIACVELNQLRLDITRPSRKTAAWPILIRKKNSSFVSLQRGNKRRRAIFTHSRACSQHSTCAHGERKRARFLLFSFSLFLASLISNGTLRRLMPIDNWLVLFRARVATFSITIEINRRKERYWRHIFPVFWSSNPRPASYLLDYMPRGFIAITVHKFLQLEPAWKILF